MAGQPAAFMSYARFDDQHDDGQLTTFRERLAAEVRMQTGEKFLIFQDRTDIAWGENWQQRINRNEYHAVKIYKGGKGVVENNDLTGNKRGAWNIAADSKGNVTRTGNRE